MAAIEEQGWSVWWDPEISPDEEFDRRIAAQLKIAAAEARLAAAYLASS